ncbi:MAG: hypothetical protein HY015_00615 [Bacteroidetes bacterium]|nr:hypothetical protein [Bacteroidota bacterium]MBI3481480.1 hypothetical protein [Bacteroidota bacterium]
MISKININGEVKEMQFNGNENGIDIGVDGTTSFNYFELAVPTNAGVTPIATYIRLSPSITDTVTYSFSSPKYPYFPDKIYYNKSLVWEIINTKPNGFWPSITIIK